MEVFAYRSLWISMAIHIFFISKISDNIDSISICVEEILPGNGIAIHKHMNEDEIPVNKGTTAFVPKGTWVWE
jgi:hypothetical protein